MIDAGDFLDGLEERRRTFLAGTPCSYLKPFINRVIDDPRLAYCDAANEGDAVALVSGAAIGGRPGAVLFQNAGLGNAVNALTSLCFPFRIPLLLIITHRGQPGGPADEPQHELMGQVTTGLLDVLRVPWRPFPSRGEDIETTLAWAEGTMRERSLPCALVMSKDDIADYALHAPSLISPPGWDAEPGRASRRGSDGLPLRHEILSAYLRRKKTEDVVVCTTGYTGREL
ncbi:MAG: phosphonopyruvate decarboxylase, partial [Candidatus Aminicenantes bacterium]|nr:phosphonopyruvate decarboxylase [Candidatus Aminicenantes bacterium]